MSRRLAVDWTRCDGHGLCARLWPERIALDDWGFPVIDPDPIPDDQMSDARRVLGVCPRLALRLDK